MVRYRDRAEGRDADMSHPPGRFGPVRILRESVEWATTADAASRIGG